jgi:LacI family transcriptional regulator
MGRVAKRIGGQLRHGKSIQDVAEAAGVSIATVSRVLNNPGLVSSKTSERVRGVIAELGYSPNPFAQGLITRESRVLGFALPDIHGEFYSGLLLGADAKARELGYHLLISAEVRTDVPAPGRRALGFGRRRGPAADGFGR